jgi:bidirectional [NiFe] hydrogenase diaphorase subunit
MRDRTGAGAGMTTVHTLRINGADVAGTDGQSILAVATENGIDIPTMCHLDGLSDTGSCRLCVVEVAGSPKLTPACTTLVVEGMEITTTSEQLSGYRRTITEMLFLERNHICAVCVANNHCELQNLAEEQQIDHFELPAISPTVGIDASHALFAIDHNRCIMCLRCVRVCDEVEGAHTWDVMGSGIDVRVVTDMGTPWGESTSCTSCGKCVQVCPTGALFEKGRSIGEGSKELRPFLPYLKIQGQEPENP